MRQVFYPPKTRDEAGLLLTPLQLFIKEDSEMRVKCEGRVYPVVRCLLIASAMVFCAGAASAQERDPKSIETAQKLHDEMNQLEVKGDLQGQEKFFHEQVVRMDSFRPMQKGRAQWMAGQRKLRSAAKFKVESITTKVENAWKDGGHLYEYGTTQMRIRTAGGASVSDPVDYFAVWAVNPNPQIQFIIWNTAAPVNALRTFSAVK
jgi:hypothetical protein